MKAINVITDEVYEFDKATTAHWAVRYAWASDNNMLSFLFSLQQDPRQDLIDTHFPVVVGRKTVMLGDWGAFKRCK